MTKPRKSKFPSAVQDSQIARCPIDSPQCSSPSFKLAFQDVEFLLRDELRPVRLQLELLKTELILQEEEIESTVVIFGSARLPDPETAQKQYDQIKVEWEKNPGDPKVKKEFKKAERALANSYYYQESRELGRLISSHTGDHNLVVMTGAGQGIMGAANRGAHEVGAKNIGLNIVLPFEQMPNNYITPELCFQFHYFAIRKMHLLMRAKAMVAFPGGFGTLDELFETLTLVQTKKMEPIPILLFGQKFWERIINFEALVEEGTISEDDLSLFHYVESAVDAWKVICIENDLCDINGHLKH